MTCTDKHGDNIRVFVRIRPFNENEEKKNCVEVLNSKQVLLKTSNQKKFNFDGVFGPESRQVILYKTMGKSLISEILSGYNCTVFAYGQTGSGKTFTMSGGVPNVKKLDMQSNVKANGSGSYSSSPYGGVCPLNEKSGLIPRVLSELFVKLHSLQQQYTVRCSYLELYNEDLRDLLAINDDPARIRIFDDQRNKGGVIIQGIEEVTVHNGYDVFKLLQKGQDKRRTAVTQMNEQSSRSHTIFSIIVHTRELGKDGEELVKMGKLNLIDLAGSENISRSGAVEKRAREAGNINQSLLTLGRVIKALAEKNTHIPFRESKLTRILRDSLGGRTKTTIIATISPCITNADETLSTLDYANNARVITNKPEVNQQISQKALMAQYVEDINRLRKDLSAAQSGEGVFIDAENFKKFLIDQEMHKKQLLDKASIICNLERQLQLIEEEKELREAEWVTLTVSFEETQIELQKIKFMYKELESEKKEHEFLAQRYQRTAEELYQESQGLLSMVKSSSYNEALLSEKVEKLYAAATQNNQTIKKISKKMEDLYNDIVPLISYYMNSSVDHNKTLLNAMNGLHKFQMDSCHEMQDITSTLKSNLDNNTDKIEEHIKDNNRNSEKWKETLINRCTDYINSVTSLGQWNTSHFNLFIENFIESESCRQNELASKVMGTLGETSSNIVKSKSNLSSNLSTIQSHIETELKEILRVELSNIDQTDDSLKEFSRWRDEVIELMNATFDKVIKIGMEYENQNANNLLRLKDMEEMIKKTFRSIREKVETFMENCLRALCSMNDMIDENPVGFLMQADFDQLFSSYDVTMQEQNNLEKENLVRILRDINNCNDKFASESTDTISKLCNTVQEGSHAVQKSVEHQQLQIMEIEKASRLLNELAVQDDKEFSEDFHDFNAAIVDSINKLKNTAALAQNGSVHFTHH
ncbi:hypothetical protein FQA39_LY14137 [Lamprigera yunnana]|nr:hypothetical protein FQA39_LY14137 [Lamprigera yunnana]